VGIHSVSSQEDAYLIELIAEGNLDDFAFDEITQEMEDIPRSSWQAPFDERLLESTPCFARYAFFFHFVNFTKPLITSFGPLELKEPTATPEHLAAMTYEQPC
jgi:hypothetical protein